MSEEDINDVVELSPIEQKASADGWRPKDEWDGDPDQWVDAKEFVFRGELMDRIKTQTKQLSKQGETIEELRAALSKLGEHNAKIAEMEYRKAVKELKRQHLRAMSEGDEDRALELGDQIDELNEARDNLVNEQKPETKNEPVNNKANAMQEAYNAWIQDPVNSWYTTDIVMAGAADKIGYVFATANPDASPSEVFSHVVKEIKKEFPERFNKGPRASKVSEPDQKGGSPSRGTKKYSPKDLNDEQRRVGKVFVDTGALPNLQAYVDQLVDLGEIG
jgi:molybdopterin converting factor small subunit